MTELTSRENFPSHSLEQVRRDGSFIIYGFVGIIGFSLGVTAGKLGLLSGSAFPLVAGASVAAVAGGVVSFVLTPVLKDTTASKTDSFGEGLTMGLIGFGTGLLAETNAPQFFSSAASTSTPLPGTVLCNFTHCIDVASIAGIPQHGYPLIYGTTEMHALGHGVNISSAILPDKMGSVSVIGSGPADLGPRGCFSAYKATIVDESVKLVHDYFPQINSGGSQLFGGMDVLRAHIHSLTASMSDLVPKDATYARHPHVTRLAALLHSHPIFHCNP